MTTEPVHSVTCHSCQASFDAMDTPWCSCLVSERTLVCPHCLTCFCKAPPGYKGRFWSAAPRELWDRKFAEHNQKVEPRQNPEPEAVTGPLVLVVEDEQDIQRMAVRVVESLGYGMVLARNGEEGLEMARRYRPDLVLTDALMPKMDGREMCLKLKTDPDTQSIKVVVMTSLYTNVNYRNQGFKNFKVDDYLSKPLDFTQLRDLLQKHLG